MKSLFFILLVACDPVGPQGFYSESMQPELAASVSLDSLDRGIEELAQWADRDGLMAQSDFFDAVRERGLRVAAVPEPFDVGGKPAAGVFYWPSSIQVVWKPGDCFASSAFLHEVTHAVLCRLMIDCDVGHTAKAWWDTEAAATFEWTGRECR